jgi:hypothetical protein
MSLAAAKSRDGTLWIVFTNCFASETVTIFRTFVSYRSGCDAALIRKIRLVANIFPYRSVLE